MKKTVKTQPCAQKNILMSGDEVGRAIKRIAHEIVEKNRGTKNLVVIGIRTRGVTLGKWVKDEITASEKGAEIPFGTLDITLYRDDVDAMDAPPAIKETEIPFDLTGKNIVLVDDVLFTGRSIRAAIDELMDFGRPQNIWLAVLVDRGGRELPIEPNFIGKKISVDRDERISVKVEEIDGNDMVVLGEASKVRK